MIKQLSIRNFAIIKTSELQFSPGLTVITGETGAGKSILLGALNLLMGARADAGQLYDENEKCVIEGHFHFKTAAVAAFFEAEDFDFDTEEIVLRRELLPNGKSRAFINDSPATATQLRTLGNLLVDISGQHETLELNTQQFQFEFVDAMAGQLDEVAAYRSAFENLRQVRQEITQLEEAASNQQKSLDYDQFLYNELEQAQINHPLELEQLEQQYSVLQNAQTIGMALQQLHFGLTEADNAPENSLSALLAAGQGIKKLDDRLAQLYTQLQETKSTLAELAQEAFLMQEAFQADEEKLHQLESRLNELNRLLQKHRLQSLSELMALKEEIAARIDAIQSSGEQLLQLQQREAVLAGEVENMAAQISAKRLAILPELEAAIHALLPEMGMVHARFQIEHKKLLHLHARTAWDQLRFLFTANQGSAAQEIHKVASGGELSRLMLAIKSLLHDQLALPTVVFDEIDTGISGETAIRIGKVLKKLASRHQVILVTHQPQIAAKGDLHLFVSKELKQGKTASHIRVLEAEDRVEELAKMIGGAQPSDIAREHARELFHI